MSNLEAALKEAQGLNRIGALDGNVLADLANDYEVDLEELITLFEE